jgi:hypothetical protein
VDISIHDPLYSRSVLWMDKHLARTNWFGIKVFRVAQCCSKMYVDEWYLPVQGNIVLVRLNEIRDIGMVVLLRRVGKLQWLHQDTHFVEGLIYQGKTRKSGSSLFA